MRWPCHRQKRVFIPVTVGIWFVGALGLAAWLVGAPATIAAAPAPAPMAFALQAAEAQHPAPDLACRLCHEDSQREITLPSGETIPVQVDLAEVDGSAHGRDAEAPLPCTGCHLPAQYQQPHAPVEAANRRQYEIERSQTCERCHQQPHLTSHPDAETEAFVTCTDCHGAHDVQSVDAWQEAAATVVCAACHEQAEVPKQEPARLLDVIQAGLFTDRPTRSYCLACHSQPGYELTFANGDVVSLQIDGNALDESVHGRENEWQPLTCTDCHGRALFPHAPVTASSKREYNLEKYTTCARCHETTYELNLDSTHGSELAQGNANAAVCTDCHGAHDTPDPSVPRERISHTCEQCHSTIFEEYATSVHGEALIGEDSPDVPTCIECHGVHNIRDPRTALFRIRSPELCAQCHADEELMSQYEISTQVFDTYVADFHGTTVTLFEHQDPDVESNKAVCYDCHGVHNIKRPDEPGAGIKANLLATCQQCHPDATSNFPNAWTSHFEPSLEHNPLVYLVNLFYQIVIPGTVGFFGLLVLTDVYRRARLRLRHGKANKET